MSRIGVCAHHGIVVVSEAGLCQRRLPPTETGLQGYCFRPELRMRWIKDSPRLRYAETFVAAARDAFNPTGDKPYPINPRAW